MAGTATPPRPPDPRVPDLTPRQREVLDLIVRGLKNHEIATELGISLDGAKWHVSEIISKLGVDTREEAADYWRAYNGLPARLTRLFRTLTAAGTLRWIVAASGAAGVVVGAAIVILALQSNDDESGAGLDGTPIPPTTSVAQGDATASTVPGSPFDCPVDEPACEAASQQFGHLVQDSLGLFAKGVPEGLYCPGDPQTQAHLMTLCEGVADGEYREGFPVLAYGEQPSAQTVAVLRDFFDEFISYSNAASSDAVGTGELRIDSIACPVNDPGCERRLGLGVTVLPDGRDRLFLLLEFERDPLAGSVSGPVFLRFRGVEYGRYADRSSTGWTILPWLQEEPLLISIPPVGNSCPVDEEYCRLAREVLAAFDRRDADSLLSLARPAPYECGRSHPEPLLCTNVEPGTVVYGLFLGGTQSGRTPYDPERFSTYLSEAMERASGDPQLRDAYGTGDLQIAAIVCNRGLQDTDPCAAGFDVVLTWMTEGTVGGTREGLAVWFTPPESDTRYIYGFGQIFVSWNTIPPDQNVNWNPWELVSTWYDWRPQ